MAGTRTSAASSEEILSRVPIFSRLARRDLKKLAKLCVPKTFAAGELVIEEGAVGLGLFLLLSGEVEIFKGKGEERVRLATMGKDDVLGEIALIDDQPRSASAVALEATECLLLTRDSFDTLVKKEPDIAWCIVPSLAERVRELHQRAMEAEDRLKEAAMPEKKKRAAGAEEAEVAPEAEAAEPEDEEEEEESDAADALLQLFRMQYGMMMSGVKGLTGMVKSWETFLKAYGDETEVSESDSLSDVFEKMPDGLITATREAMDAMEDLPQEMADAFRRYTKKS